MASVRHLGLFPKPNTSQWPCLDLIPEYYEGRDKVWHQVTVEQAVRIYWRVKKWQIVVDAEYIEPIYEFIPDDPNVPEIGEFVLVGSNTVPVTSVQQYDPVEPLELETDLVCKTNSAAYWYGDVVNAGDLIKNIGCEFDASEDFFVSSINIRKDQDGILYVAFEAYITGEEGPGAGRTVLPVSFTDDSDNPLQFSFSWSGSQGDASWSGTATVKPLEWWEYDPSDGLGPIYDKTTGAQLR